MNNALQEKLAALPQQPGVYRFFDESGRLLYIGKATNLRSRVRSYFRASTKHSAAKEYMVNKIADVEVTIVESEPDALLLETTLIKKHKPPYNVIMKDDKNYQYIHITDEPFPRIETVRSLPLSGRSGSYYGPYTSGGAVKRTLRLLKTVYRYCEKAPQEKRGKLVYPERPCLDYHLGRCIGACAQDVTPEQYQAIFKQIQLFLQGEYEAIRDQLLIDMNAAVEAERFEDAALYRDQLEAIAHMMQQQSVVSTNTREQADYLSLARLGGKAAVNVFTVRRGKVVRQHVIFLQHADKQSDDEIMEAFVDQYYAQMMSKPPHIFTSVEQHRGRRRKLLDMGVENAGEALERQQASFEKKEQRAARGLQELAGALGMKPEKLKRIEIYDISHHQGAHTVGSMVTFIDGLPEPSQYRKFNVKTVSGPDDFQSMREVINRRVRHLPKRAKGKTSVWPRPDLIIIDGGKGQLSSAKAMLDAAKLNIPIVSLAKREEEIFLPEQSEALRLKEGSEGYYFVQRMRDEAHRFAIGFYRSQHLRGLV